ncbi:MAG: class II aldolase/adducin family protein [Motiliproteus sp.]
MQSLWSDKEAAQNQSVLDLRVYSSRLLGSDPALVLHGGGNTSVKARVANLFGDEEDILFVKGSGWDLATIQAEGFAPVRMDTLLKMAALEHLSDSDMVSNQRAAMIDPSAPNPSVEAILHAVIPYKFVDHTHTDAVVTLTNTADGEALIRAVYGDRVLIVPYVMPGFELARLIYRMTLDVDWDGIDGIVLMNHGLFTFADDARTSYEKHIELVTAAEAYLERRGATLTLDSAAVEPELLVLARIRRAVSQCRGQALIAHLNDSPVAVHFSTLDVPSLSNRGTLTPEHVIRTKRAPLFLTGAEFKGKEFTGAASGAALEEAGRDSGDLNAAVDRYAERYRDYFATHHSEGQICLNPAPGYAVWKDRGAISFGKSLKEAQVIRDINDHTFEAILKAEQLGGYQALDEATLFEIEYWELEQAKLKKGGGSLGLSGKVVLVTDAQTPLGEAVTRQLQSQGASVVACGSVADIETTVYTYGGLDILVITKPGADPLLKAAQPYLQEGIDPVLICIGCGLGSCSDATPEGVRLVRLGKRAGPEGVAALAGLLSGELFSDLPAITAKSAVAEHA